MCQFQYEYNKNSFGNNTRLLFTDMDSLMYEIKTEDGYEDCNIVSGNSNFMLIQLLVKWKMKQFVYLSKNLLDKIQRFICF